MTPFVPPVAPIRARKPATSRTVVNVLWGMLVLLCLGGLAFGVWNGEREHARLANVAKPATRAERARGIVRGAARIVAATPKSFPPCIVEKTGKNKNPFGVHGDSQVTLDDGTELRLRAATDIRFFLGEGPTGSEARAVDAARARVRGADPSISIRSIRCLGPKEKVWVEGCLRGDDELVACPSDDEVLFTMGGPSERETWVRSHAMGSVSLALLAVVTLLGTVWSFASHDRSVIPTLAETRGVRGFPGVGTVFIVLSSFGVFITVAMWVTTYAWFFLTAFVSIIAVLSWLAMIARARVLGAAKDVVAETATSTLQQPGPSHRELAVRVPVDVQRVEGFRAGEHHAAVRFVVTERYKERRNNKTVVASRELVAAVHPPHVVIEDASGRGALDLERCVIDVEDEPTVTWGGPNHAPDWLAARFGAQITLSPQHDKFEVTWATIDPGEPLLVYGDVERVMPDALAARVEPRGDGYRAAADVPLVRARDGQKAIAHVGAEGPLLAGIARERLVVTLTLLALAASILVASAALVAIAQT